MGTNFYLYPPPCPHCGRGDDRIHIGKSSAGWCFSLHVYPESEVDGEAKPRSLAEWQEWWSRPFWEIRDEYNNVHTPEEMLERITKRGRQRTERSPAMYRDWSEFHAKNNSQDGPNGLVRHCIDGRYCIGHGDGTYDLLIGEFS